jgi:hypothetical protein
MAHVRPPAVAGTFYPAQPERLVESVDALLGAVGSAGCEAAVPKALVVPHAGYMYSGAVAATAFARIRPVATAIRRVVLLGPAHRVHLRGVAAPEAEVFDTPLGPVTLDTDLLARISLPKSTAVHAREHSLEVQLPFLLRLLDRFQLVPIAVGDARPEEVAALIEALWGGPETLVLISSDLSHYLPYADARQTDARTAGRIVALDAPILHEEACGATPINGLLLAARKRGLATELLDLRNSGDTAGGKGEVVGYGAFAFFEPSA